MAKKGILLLNLGTPAAPTTKAVRTYLKEFLSDPYVIDLPWLVRQILLYAVILPFRPKKSQHAYQKIWQPQGSPLRYYSEQFKQALAAELNTECVVTLGMRYGEPSIRNAVYELKQQQCQEIIIAPLFPQYSLAATGSAVNAARQELARYSVFSQITVLSSFFQVPAYQQLMANLVNVQRKVCQPDFILFSYHGLPERQLLKAGCRVEQCDRNVACALQPMNLQRCYRAQCFATSQAIAQWMGLQHQDYMTVFQSRLGRAAWIQPYADKVLPILIAQGVRRLMVVCPSFVADCLETLEEIGMRLKAQWLALGGVAFTVVPCLNDDPEWVRVYAHMLTTAACQGVSSVG